MSSLRTLIACRRFDKDMRDFPKNKLRNRASWHSLVAKTGGHIGARKNDYLSEIGSTTTERSE